MRSALFAGCLLGLGWVMPLFGQEPAEAPGDGPLVLPRNADAQSDPSQAAPKKPATDPYKGVFYDNDFSYLEDPSNSEYHFGDFWKRRNLGERAVFDVGGEYRVRQHNEHILTRDNNFLLERTRIYGNLEVEGWIRLYGEAIDATSARENLPPRSTEENRFDALNLFATYAYTTAAGGIFRSAPAARNCSTGPSG